MAMDESRGGFYSFQVPMKRIVEAAGWYVLALFVCLAVARLTDTEESDVWPIAAVGLAFIFFKIRHWNDPKDGGVALPRPSDAASAQLLAAKYRPVLQDSLRPGEKLINAGAAVSVTIAERHGRGSGEGVLALTDRGLVFRLDAPVPGVSGIAIPREEISKVSSKWIAMPQMRELVIETTRNISSNFYTGELYVKEIEDHFRR